MRRIAAFFALMVILGAAAYFLSLRKGTNITSYSHVEKKLHLAGEPSVMLQHVLAKVVYFSPSDLVTSTENWNWKETVLRTMGHEQAFFKSQLGMDLRYLVFDNVVAGKNTHELYDGSDTSHGNPNALVSVREEILNRVLDPSGDLYYSEFASGGSSDYQILVIIYEGTGASAVTFQTRATSGEDVLKIEKDGPPAIILSSAFLNSKFYKEFGDTTLAHEMSHTFGLSDSYDLDSGANIGGDLMGEGRRRVLNMVYLSDQNRRSLGGY
jgi:hypothetical protein